MKPKWDDFMDSKQTMIQANASAKAAFLQKEKDDSTPASPQKGNYVLCTLRGWSCLLEQYERNEVLGRETGTIFF